MGPDQQRIISWRDPAEGRAQAAGWSGLEIMRAIRDGILPPPPMARLIGFACVVAEPGEITMELIPDQSLENLMGLVHGGAAATMLDTAMGAAAHTVLPADKASVTLDLKVNYLRPLTLASGPIRATGKVLNPGRSNIYVEGQVRDGAGRLVAHAVGNFSVVAAPG
uniref:Thioesterase superfamily protein n=1 Tax=Caulobacter sp. (strain K31) TaxID=366602 RepID=B0T934_CAUSK